MTQWSRSSRKPCCWKFSAGILPLFSPVGFLKNRLAIRRSQLAILLPLFLLVASPVSAKDDPFVGPSNWGLTGLMEMPTARVLNENSFRVGASQEFPYRYYYGTIGLFKGLEINGRVTEILGVRPVGPGFSSSYGDYKDKAIDFKYQFWSEGKYSPALAIGIMDPHGTSLYAGQFLVASKQIYPFDFTLGFGNGRFGKRPLQDTGNDFFRADIFSDPKQWLKDAQPFWGIQFSPSEKYSLMVEYNPIQYQKQTFDPAQPKYFTRPVPLNYNFGFRWRPLKWTEIDLTYQRGNQFGLNLSTLFDIGTPLVPIYDKPYREEPRNRINSPGDRITTALREQGFSDIGVAQEKDTLLIRAQNDKYFYSMRAVGVILKTVAVFVPPSVEHVRITLTKTGIPLFELLTTRDDIQDLCADRLTVGEFFYASKINTDVADAPDILTAYRKLFAPGLRPSFETFLNDPSGFFKYRLGAEGWVAYQPWTGTSLVGSLELYPLNNISSSNIPPREAVRSDLWLFERQNVGLGRLMVDQVYKPSDNLYTRFAAGLLEIEYAGIDGEAALPLANGRFLVGLQASLVKKRSPNNPFGLDESAKKYYDVEFLNTRLNIPEMDMALDFKTGRFLGSDFGTRVTLTKYVKDVSLYAWYSFTNTSVFTDQFNRGYHDAGIGVTIPLRLFEGTDSKTAYNYSLSPWTRDVAQDLYRYQNLFDFIGRDTKVFLQKDRQMAD